MNKINSQSILIKLLLPIIAVTIGTVTALTLFILNNERVMLQRASEQNISIMRESLIMRGRILSNNLARQTEYNLDSFDFQTLSALYTKSSAYDEELSYVILMDKSGVAYIHTGSPEAAGHQLEAAEDQFALSQKKPGINEFTKSNVSMIEFIIPIQQNKKIWGYLRLGYSLNVLNAKTSLSKQALYDEINANIWNTVLISIGFILLGILVAYYVSRKITQPLSELTSWAQELSRGKFNATHTINKQAFRELTLLVDSFEQMSKNLLDSTQKLADYNHKLTEKNKALESATRLIEAADERKNELLDQLVGELRGPMQFIIGTNDVLLENEWVQKNKGFKSSLEMIQKTCRKLIESTDELQGLKNMKIKGNSSAISIVPGEVLIDGVPELMAHILIDGKVKFEIENQVEGQFIQTDKRIVNDVIMNLLRNAARFTRAGSISLSLKIIRHDLEIKVSDTGIGIPEALIKTIFEPGTQIRNGLAFKAEEETGAGMGLHKAKTAVSSLGGKIDVESIEEQGTIFTVMIPEVTTG